MEYQAHTQTGILLNANEYYDNQPEEIRSRLAELAMTMAYNRYPDNSQTVIREAYAKAMNLTADQILAGNGSDQMLGYIISRTLKPHDVLVTLKPDFSMYDYYAESYGAKVAKFACNESGDFDVDEFIAFAKKKDAKMILFSNPNNPTGHCLSIADVEKIVTADHKIPVVIDEAYMEFADEESALSLVDKHDNLYVTRTLSKAYGLAGLRVGFLVTNARRMQELRGSFVPYALNSFSAAAAAIVLEYDISARVDAIKAERDRVYEALKDDVWVYPSAANFLYARSDHKEALLEALAEKDIVIRNYAGTPYFRITIGTPEDNDTIIQIVRENV